MTIENKDNDLLEQKLTELQTALKGQDSLELTKFFDELREYLDDALLERKMKKLEAAVEARDKTEVWKVFEEIRELAHPHEEKAGLIAGILHKLKDVFG